MKTQPTIIKEKTTNGLQNLLLKWASKYINSMTKALYPDTDTVKSRNDKNRIFYK
ncbi:hypothetical protein SAMN04487910_3082 [Aquimarina amphilecti]|uniref:Uncharacterized protein n=1 Tax=Aquimarina amphilecti TaxID=1038014 RepID=A0A1H7SB05_AQUAM|nr:MULTISPECIES: hypothetical protein [Aquimarina]SEL69821.1 hypothetical protein SAMN04487910_3082 [Aquimarina amphilecti]